MENEKRKRQVVDLVEQARQLRLQAEDLEKKVQLARGTRDRARKPTGQVLVKPSRGPHWTGDEGTTEDLMATIQRMLTERPWRFAELLEATGARDNRIKGVIMRLQREGVRVFDVAPEGTGKALWFIPSDEVLARIASARRAAAAKRR